MAYDELARAVNRPKAQRAVANANGQNRIAIIIANEHDASLRAFGFFAAGEGLDRFASPT